MVTEENTGGYCGSPDDIMMTEGNDSTSLRPLKIPPQSTTAIPRQSSGLEINDNTVGGGGSDENIHLNTLNGSPISSLALFANDTDASFENEDGRGADMDSKCGAQFLGNGYANNFSMPNNNSNSEPPLSEYELLRLRKIKRNEARLAQLGLLVPAAAAATTKSSSSSHGTSALTSLLTEASNSTSNKKKRKKRDTNAVLVKQRVLPNRRCKETAAAQPTLPQPSSLPFNIDYSFSSTEKSPMPIGHTDVSKEDIAFLDGGAPPPLGKRSTAVVEDRHPASAALAFAPPSLGNNTDVSEADLAFMEEPTTAPPLGDGPTAVVASRSPAPVAVAAAATAAPSAKRRKPHTRYLPTTSKGKRLIEAVDAIKTGDPRVEGLSLRKVAEMFGVNNDTLKKRVPAEYKNGQGIRPASSDPQIANAQSIYQSMIQHKAGTSFFIWSSGCSPAESALLPKKTHGKDIYGIKRDTMNRYVNKDEKFSVETGMKFRYSVPKEWMGKLQLVKVTENGHLQD